MNAVSNSKRLTLALCCCFVLAPLPGIADDIDIFNASQNITSSPKVMILMDNSNNWVSDLPQGKAKFTALNNALAGITVALDVGLAMYSPNGGDPQNGKYDGAYIRFGARDMSVPTNRTKFKTLTDLISADANVTKETGAQKDESAAFYEIFKYFSGLNPRSGRQAQAPYVDSPSNTGAPSYPGATAFDQGFTTGYALAGPNGPYNSVAASCARNYIIYIVANNNVGSALGSQTYEGVNAGPALPPPGPGAVNTWADEWARLMFRNQNPQIVTYIIDTWNPNSGLQTNYQKLLQSIAKQGGGTYLATTTPAGIQAELTRIFDEIQSVNSSFASVSLPINATTRTQNDNQVYIGMFRPDNAAKPRWFGNLKQYQLVDKGSGPELGDSLGNSAVNPLTGFVNNCAVSYWTTDTNAYWQTAQYTPTPAGTCPTSTKPYSDLPDGPFVEKGAVAEFIRNGNGSATSPPAWTGASAYRSMFTLGGTPPAGPLAAISTTNTNLDATTLDWLAGRDVDNENNVSPTPSAAAQLPRFSVHGDIIHSRPYVVDQSNLSRGVTAYYGANDGALRAVDTATGKERWSFYSPESTTLANMSRLRNNTPPVTFSGSSVATSTPKDYYFDGPIGAYQNADNSSVWLYAGQRRGGRMLYAFDVSAPDSPSFKWRRGCPNTANDTNCTAGMTGIGQTWAAPTVAFIEGYGGTGKPVVILGGGYDTCEDADTSSPTCSSPKGNVVYILDGNDGSLIKAFSTDRSVAADVTPIDINNDGYVDYAYVATTGGSVYRIDFVSDPYTAAKITDPSLWTMRKIAYTSGSGRKFLHAPTVLANVKAGSHAKVYVALGTGDREKPLAIQYPYATPVSNRFYVYLDDLTQTSSSSPTPTAANLDTVSSSNMNDFTKPADATCSTTGVLPTGTNKGWFIDLRGGVAPPGAANVGEQTVTSALIAGGMVTFSTSRPTPPLTNSCAFNLGEARGYWLNLVNGSGAVGAIGSCGGSQSTTFVGGGLPPSPVLASVSINGVFSPVVIGAVDRKGGASAPIQAQKITAPVSLTRHPVYWNRGGDN